MDVPNADCTGFVVPKAGEVVDVLPNGLVEGAEKTEESFEGAPKADVGVELTPNAEEEDAFVLKEGRLVAVAANGDEVLKALEVKGEAPELCAGAAPPKTEDLA